MSLEIHEALAPAQLCYGQHSFLFGPDGVQISSQQGVQQGDPLGPLFFALAWNRAVKGIGEDLTWRSWYLDDGNLVGPMGVLHEVLARIVRAGAEVGLTSTSTSAHFGGRVSTCRAVSTQVSHPISQRTALSGVSHGTS